MGTSKISLSVGSENYISETSHDDRGDINTCDQACCALHSEISQPTDPTLLKKTEKSYRSDRNARTSFLPSGYKQFPWIYCC